MKVKIKKLHEDAVIPHYATDGSAGMDLTAVDARLDEYGNIHYEFGLAFEIPKGYVGLIFPRSSVAKYDLALTNAVGVVDSDFRGGISAKFKPTLIFSNASQKDGHDSLRLYGVGERVAQMIIMPYPKIEFEEVEELSNSGRGCGGYGSTNTIREK